MSIENLIFLLFVVLLPLIEWLSRLVRERQAGRRPRVEPPAAPRPPAQLPPRAPAPAPGGAHVQTSPAPPPAKKAPPARTPARPPAARPIAHATVRDRASLGHLRGREALRRAVIARVVLGPCRADAPFRDVDR